MINTYKNKKVLILGLGLNGGGVGSAKFFAKEGGQVRVTDLRDARVLKNSLEKLFEYGEIEYVLENHRLSDIDWADIVIRNQAIKPGNEFLEYAKKKNKKIETDFGIFLERVSPKQIIGVTGTKGKSTTSSLIYQTMKAEPRFNDNGRKVVMAGNIGKSVLDALSEIDLKTLVVLEISSFQLEAFEGKHVSPHFSVITNIFPDHLNYYKNMEEYIGAKRVIAKYQKTGDILFIPEDNKIVNSTKFLKDIASKIIKFSKKNLPKDFKPTLPGAHNLSNYAAAFMIAKTVGVKEEDTLKAFEEFEGVEYRLQLVKEFDGIKIYNDSAATTPDATISALKTFNNAILICGGMNKELDYEELAHQIERSVKCVYFLEGDATDELKKHIKHRNIFRSTYDNLNDILKDVRTDAKKGDIVLFSPAATSFNLFQNEFDRGKKFNESVNRFFK